MKNKKNLIILSFLVIFLSISFPLRITRAQDSIDKLVSAETDSPPTIDGIFDDESEWADAELASFYHSNPSVGHPPEWVYIYTMHTEDKLFILIDDIPDITNDTTDALPIYFDCNDDGIVDDNITMYLEKNNSITWIGNTLADWKVGFGASVNNNTEHTIFEIAINITLDSAYDGSSKPSEMDYILPVGTEDYSIKLGLNAPPSVCNWTVPYELVDSDPTTYATLEFEVAEDEADTSDGEPDKQIPFSSLGSIGIISTMTILGIILLMRKQKQI